MVTLRVSLFHLLLRLRHLDFVPLTNQIPWSLSNLSRLEFFLLTYDSVRLLLCLIFFLLIVDDGSI